MKKILITGGAGYIGTVLVEILSSRAKELGIERITVLDNLMYKQDGLFALLSNPIVHFIYGDVRNYSLLGKLIKSHDVIFPLAAIVGFPACDKNPKLAEEINFNHVCLISNEAPLGTKIIFPNTNSGYGATDGNTACDENSPLNPISIYGITKCKAEKEVLAANGIVFRLATVFGTSYRFRKDLLVNDFVLRALVDKFIVLFEPHFKRNFIHVRDVAEAFIFALINYDRLQGNIFNLGLSSANLSKLELCEAIKTHVPNFVIQQDSFATDIDKRNYIVSNKKIESAGWEPKFTLDMGITELIRAYPILINSDTKYTNL